jgi:hypothetical protein
VNDGKKVEGASHQVMKCILCYVNLVNVPNPRTKERKDFKTYYKTYGIIALKKHVDANHFIIAKKIEEEINNGITESVERQLAKIKAKCLRKCNFWFFCCKITFQKGWCVAKRTFCKALAF